MDRTATVTYQRIGTIEGAVPVARGRFGADRSSPGVESLRQSFNVPGVAEFVLESAVVKATSNTSVAVRRLSAPAESLFLVCVAGEAGASDGASQLSSGCSADICKRRAWDTTST